MPEKVGYRVKKGTVLLLASMMMWSGCSAAGVVPAATDALEESAPEESSMTQEPEEKAYDASIALLWVVNDENTLPKNYEPAELLDVGGVRLAQKAAEAYIALQRGMDIDGAGKLSVIKGYCSWQDQERLVEERRAYYEQQGYDAEKAQTFAAYDCGVPGSDPYQTGLMVCVQAEENGKVWLDQYAVEYGFALRTTEEGTELRYVGELYAAAMKQLSMDFDQFMEYMDSYKKSVFSVEGVLYQAELVSDLSRIEYSTVSICSDNRGGYVALSRQEQ